MANATIAARYLTDPLASIVGTEKVPLDDGGVGKVALMSSILAYMQASLAAVAQPLHANLTAFSGLTLAADKLPYGNGAGTLALADFTAYGRSLVAGANAAAVLSTLGVTAFLATATLAAGALTASAPMTLTQTWNNAGATFEAFVIDVTSTLSAAASLPLNIKVGGTSKFRVDKAGTVTIDAATSGGYKFSTGTGIADSGTGILLLSAATSPVYILGINPTSARLDSTVFFGWSSSTAFTTDANIDTRLYRDAAATLAQRVSTTAQAFRVYNTWTDASNGEWGTFDWTTTANFLTIGAKKNGSGIVRSVDIVGNSIQLTAGAPNGQIRLFPAGANEWRFDNTGHFFPVTNNTYDIGASGATSPRSIYFGTSLFRGSTKILGAQEAAVADATDAPSTMARLNDLLARLRTHGLIAT